MAESRAWFDVLGVSPVATEVEIRAAYIGLVKRWHPDRFVGRPDLEPVAHERLKTINAAYDEVRQGPASRNRPRPKRPPPARAPATYEPAPAESVLLWSPFALFSGHLWVARAIATLVALLLLTAMLGR
jgi:hypothetical protein